MNPDYAHPGSESERVQMPQSGRKLALILVVAGLVALLASVALGWSLHDDWRRFYSTYLVSFLFCLSIAIGGLFFVLLQHLTRAGWSVSVRRMAEALAATLPVLAILAVPIVVSVIALRGQLYPWARPLPTGGAAEVRAEGHGPAMSAADHAGTLDSLTLAKRAFLNPTFFLVRLAVYLGVWAGLAIWYWRTSLRQDQTGDAGLTTQMQTLSAPAMLLYAITVTGAAFDLLMSLDPHWYSTIFGVYFFAGCAVAIFAAIIAAVCAVQRAGLLHRSITREHYHDLGKFLFGFTFFWGYIAFSQYMLIWYANIPEETAWLRRHGMSTDPANITAWSGVALALLFGYLLIPFAGLLSRHVKRNAAAVTFWAVWMLIFHYVDLYWLVMPQIGPLTPRLIDLAALVGVGGIFAAEFLRRLSGCSLRPLRDPRLEESLEFENV